MGETTESENAAFWLPSHFITDDDFLPVSDHHFPLDFYPFAPLSGNAKEKKKKNYDHEFLPELTRQLAISSLNHSPHQKSWNLSTSPQSTLMGLSSNASPSGDTPPLTPPSVRNAAAWDLLYEAATQVAHLKMAAQLQHQHTGGFPLNYHHHRHHNSFHNYSEMWGHHRKTERCTSGGCNNLHHSACRYRHNFNHPDFGPAPVFLGSGQTAKKKSSGTGVFIPRRYGAHPEPLKNPSGADIIMTKRNAVMNQQSSVMKEMPVTMVGQDVRLPIDWSY